MLRVSHLSLSADGLAFNCATGDSFTVNDAALLILKAMQDGGGQDEAVSALTDTYQLPRAEAERDVGDFHDRLRSLKLLA
jgi:hypothetical protein